MEQYLSEFAKYCKKPGVNSNKAISYAKAIRYFLDSKACKYPNSEKTIIVQGGSFTITNNNGDILDSIPISMFSRSPHASFSRLKLVVE